MIDTLVALQAPLLRLGIRAALEGADDCRVVGEVATRDAVLPAVRRLRPDLVILDTDFQREEPSLIGRISRAHPGCAVLVMVNHSDEECVVRSLVGQPDGVSLSDEALGRLDECCLLALRHSARGCVPKVASADRLLGAVRSVAAGEIAAGPWLDALLGRSRDRRAPGAPQPRRITARELEVISLVARGLENKEIARQLGIREQTVKNHVSRVMRKVQVRNRQELAVFAVNQRLVRLR